MNSTALICCVFSLVLFALNFFVLFTIKRNDGRKYSLKECQKKIRILNRELNEITNERIENAKDDAIAITKRFNDVEEELKVFYSKLDVYKELERKLDNVDSTIQNTVERNIKRDEIIRQMNSEIEEIKNRSDERKSHGGADNGAVREIIGQLEDFSSEFNAFQKKHLKLQKTIDEIVSSFENQFQDLDREIAMLKRNRNSAGQSSANSAEFYSLISDVTDRIHSIEERLTGLEQKQKSAQQALESSLAALKQQLAQRPQQATQSQQFQRPQTQVQPVQQTFRQPQQQPTQVQQQFAQRSSTIQQQQPVQTQQFQRSQQQVQQRQQPAEQVHRVAVSDVVSSSAHGDFSGHAKDFSDSGSDSGDFRSMKSDIKNYNRLMQNDRYDNWEKVEPKSFSVRDRKNFVTEGEEETINLD